MGLLTDSLFQEKAKTPAVQLPATAAVQAPEAVTERELGSAEDEDQTLTKGAKRRGKASLKIGLNTAASQMASKQGANYASTAASSVSKNPV
ncbi:hypothetical protein DBR00_02490 [Pseudomonas sp. HMWF032]|uniref:hypothetical protein n=1 Tax=Pseudomonas sp. HMWF032 TaxID=2056866 RepID=UPI000D34FC47|nr:hypothetical protein [Pseudomonas sp. HMWF032]PTS86443.1 hypothetical protein DBR00_02490 [Pseudomonas sp. HMWF032]PTT81368.1 hypothetical protein DBR41_17040 [Pseudomonas sp. HMWF010]